MFEHEISIFHTEGKSTVGKIYNLSQVWSLPRPVTVRNIDNVYVCACVCVRARACVYACEFCVCVEGGGKGVCVCVCVCVSGGMFCLC